jgi:HSP20 family molecular chaperone IbpA
MYTFLDSTISTLTNIDDIFNVMSQNEIINAKQYKFKLKDKEYSLTYDLPGYIKDDIETSITKKTLTITAKNESRGLNKLTVIIPDDSSDDIKLSLENGVLTIKTSIVESKIKKIKWL